MKYWIRYILNILILGSIAVGFWTAGEYAFYKVMPMSYWLEYQAVKPIKTEFKDGEKIIFQSIYEVKRPHNIEYTDTLRCNIGDDFGFYSQFISISQDPDGLKEIKDVQWTYQGQQPVPPRTCYLDTVIELELPFGIKKQQHLIGDNFQII